MAEGHGVVFQRLIVDRDTEWRTNSILPAVTFADGVFLVVLDVIVYFKTIEDFPSFVMQSILRSKRQSSCLHRSQRRMEEKHRPRILLIRGAQVLLFK